MQKSNNKNNEVKNNDIDTINSEPEIFKEFQLSIEDIETYIELQKKEKTNYCFPMLLYVKHIRTLNSKKKL